MITWKDVNAREKLRRAVIIGAATVKAEMYGEDRVVAVFSNGSGEEVRIGARWRPSAEMYGIRQWFSKEYEAEKREMEDKGLI